MELKSSAAVRAQQQSADEPTSRREITLTEPALHTTDLLTGQREAMLSSPAQQSADEPAGQCETMLPNPAGQADHPLCLRPHHLLCTVAWIGKGYDEAFTAHMDKIVHRLRTEERTPVRLIFCTDELCSACPHMQGPDLCSTNEKVKALDQRTAACFHLEPQTYIYQELIRGIRRAATPELIDQICGDCSWYSVTNCRELILKSPLR